MTRMAVCLALATLGALSLATANAADPAPAASSSAQSTSSGTRIAHPDFNWSEWQRIPVFSDGRLKPLDSLADEVVNLITGRSKWADPDAEAGGSKEPHTFSAPELLYSWITRPDDWIERPIFRCEYRPLREKLNTDKIKIPVTGTFIALGQILDWTKSEESGRPVYWSKDLEDRLIALDKAGGKSPDSVGDTAEDRAINGKVAELFRHVKAWLDLRHGNDIYVVPGLDPRALSRQTNPDEPTHAWITLGSLLEADKSRGSDDVTVAAIMASDRDELARRLLDPRRANHYASDDPNHPRNLVTILPQLAQAQNVKSDLQIEIRNLKKALDETRTAYDANDRSAFDSSMHAFVEQVRRLAKALEAARRQMTPPEKNAFKFGLDDKLNEIIWARYEALPLFEPQMQFSAYPPPGSLETEITYNKYQPFRSAWAVFLVALCVIVTAGMLKSSKLVFATGLAITLAAILYAAWGFSLRIAIAARPPVTNMYETVIWASFVVSVLGLWFCLLPLTWPGLSWAWRLAGLPVRRRGEGHVPILFDTSYVEIDRPKPEDAGKILVGAMLPVQCVASIVRLCAFFATDWFLTRSDTSFRIIHLMPPIFGKAVAMSAVGTWLVGMAVVCGCSWFGSRALITLVLSSIAVVPEAAKNFGTLWQQTFQRRYFLLGALPVACFGMMLAHFVGMASPEIFNPRVGSITAVLRNNYWLAIHVLTIVSSYGAGGLAWGLGNLAMFFYLFGKYRAPGQAAPGVAGQPGGSGAPQNGGPIFDLDAHYRGGEPSLAARLKKAGEALKPAMLTRTIAAGFESFGTGDQHLASAATRPPKEVATLASYTYKAQQVAVLLLAAGTILGGLWADVSWGRFWDWDPKEVWALISLLAYLVVLHGRFAGWVGTFGTNVGGVLCFSAILFSWYGVNFVLPMVNGWLQGTNVPTEVGLHAYAVGSGGLGYVSTAVVLNLLLVVAAWGRYAAETTDLLSRTPGAKSETQPITAGTSAS
jgi:ABC-type transport system involved in cytochrome c biogenesis permease subunit